MKIGVISNAEYCVPLLQLLKSNHITASVFSDAALFDKDGAIAYFCKGALMAHRVGSEYDLYVWLKSEKFDMVFMMGYAHLIDTNLVSQALSQHFYNIHFGALPDFRGPQPVFWQIKLGESHLTTTIHRVNVKFDEGGIVWQKKIERSAHHSYGMAHLVLGQVSLEGVVFLISCFIQKKEVLEQKQDESKGRYYQRPRLKDIQIDWQNMTAQEIVNLVQACNPWNKGASTFFQGNEIKIIDAESYSSAYEGEGISPGSIVNAGQTLEIFCIDGKLLSVYMLNINGVFYPARYSDLMGIVVKQRFI
jgi:methionyl-tRNA formyltransferase